jgi:uncharacterized membrane protein
MELLIALITATVIMGVLDFVWLGLIAKNLYYNEMGDILLKKPNMVPAVMFYSIYVVGALTLVVMPALQVMSFSYALGYGAMLGFVAYATYDLTNLATLRGFSQKIVVVDLLWGAFMTAVVCAGSYLAASWIG